ncbi:MAG: aminotransferase class I/II-fold pyridoxal phosphate-dependent enzyme, partial [Acetatifactor sp.]|nr:aminotransferase class I/II-fold pyridoxal phosphate-dependent enzyme [Acetatifactor sp.]
VDNGDSLEQLTLISNDILETYKEGLFVIKSISKSYGVPGIRLGVMASADKVMVKEIKKNIPIWNINSFGEFYMQIAEKYNKDYVAAINKIKITRRDFLRKLEQLTFLRPIPSQANYIMCEIVDGTKSIDMASYLLRRNILIKDLSEKIGNGKQYIRLAVRCEEENDYLVECMKEYEASKR